MLGSFNSFIIKLSERKTFRFIMAISGILILIIHFGLLSLYVVSANPISTSLQVSNTYAYSGFFGQSWAFFSPNPDLSDYAVVVSCNPDDIKTSKEVNISKGIYESVHSYMLSSRDMVRRVWEFAISDYLNLTLDDYSPQEIHKRRTSIKSRLQRLVSIAANDICSAPITHLKASVWSSDIAPWSKRYGEYKSQRIFIDLGSFQFDSSVGKFHFWERSSF